MELDPYWKWLGIPPEQQPADHYTLLGIARFETDADVIENAAVRQMTHVRSFQGGRHVAISQQLLNELSTARLCLLNVEMKRVYDQQLQDQQAAREVPMKSQPVATKVSPSGQLPVAQVVQPPVAPAGQLPVAQAGQLPVTKEVSSGLPKSSKTFRRSRRRRQRRHADDARRTWVIILVVAAVLLACACIGVIIARPSWLDRNSDVHSVRIHHLSMANHQCLHNVC